MSRFQRALPIKLHDCVRHGPDSGAELFVVEGDSAAASVAGACDPQRQAVLPLQGKPLNAARATAARVARDPFLGALAQALGTGWGSKAAAVLAALVPLARIVRQVSIDPPKEDQ
jgi:DNA gyrase/topoisomerase IV subunit B